MIINLIYTSGNFFLISDRYGTGSDQMHAKKQFMISCFCDDCIETALDSESDFIFIRGQK